LLLKAIVPGGSLTIFHRSPFQSSAFSYLFGGEERVRYLFFDTFDGAKPRFLIKVKSAAQYQP
jgi:hypothetical protein